jgi:hypothetical protein
MFGAGLRRVFKTWAASQPGGSDVSRHSKKSRAAKHINRQLGRARLIEMRQFIVRLLSIYYQRNNCRP